MKTFAEFFAGIGLMGEALRQEGWRIAFANDIDPKKEEIYRANFPDADKHFVPGDIHQLSASDIPSVTLATASFPCNDLSLAGGRKGLKGAHSSAFWGFTKILEEMKTPPPLALIENVPGFLTSHSGRDFETAMLALNKLGYAVDPILVDAAWFVPQSRKRLFVIGSRESASTNTEIEARLRMESRFRPPALTRFIETHSKIGWRLREFPDPPAITLRLDHILEDLPGDHSAWWSKARAEYLLDQMNPRHRDVADRMIAGKTWSHGTIFRRMRNNKSTAELRIDGFAGCLRTPRGGSGRQILFKAGRGEYHARLLTPRECARLMGADKFKTPVRANQALFGFGDAVCVPAVRWIARNGL